MSYRDMYLSPTSSSSINNNSFIMNNNSSVSPETKYLNSFGDDPLAIADLDLSFNAMKTFKSSSPREKPLERLRRIKGLVPYVNLKRLDLSGNVLSLVDGISSLHKLEILNLSRNNIRTLSEDAFHGLVSLQMLNLSGNFLSTIPTCIKILHNLTNLDMSGNKIHRLEDVQRLRTLPTLKNLNLSGNKVCGAPNYRNFVLYHVPHLDDLDLTIVTEHNRLIARRAFHKLSKEETTKLKRLKIKENQTNIKAKKLEDDNQRLRAELTAKSKLLNQKNQQWTSMTEELTQVKTELAFMKIDDRVPALNH